MKGIVCIVLFAMLQVACGQLYAQKESSGSELKAGMKAPNFNYLDVNGKRVSLEDLCGKYVFIDFWATWCGPCRGELPHLKRLEERLKGKKIVFVSISSDTNRKEWKAFVEKHRLGGIQLNIDGDRRFLDVFRVKWIPHFVLLDKKGRVVDMQMPRPSSPGTYEYLSGLKGL